MVPILLLRVIGAATALFTCMAASAETRQIVASVAGWQIIRVVDGDVRACGMLGTYNDGSAITFYRSPRFPNGVMLEVSNPSWVSLKDGRKYSLVVKVGSRRKIDVDGTGRESVSTKGLVFGVPLNDFLKSFDDNIGVYLDKRLLIGVRFSGAEVEAFYSLGRCYEGLADPFATGNPAK